MDDCPMPGQQVDGATVIASGYHTPDGLDEAESYGLLLLDPTSPFYRLALADAEGVSTIRTHFNIVPAAADFDETFGFWGGR
jgi:hypothetical protein